MNKDLDFKIERLLKIYTIPLEEGWEKCTDSDSYTVYKYWSSLGLINNSQFNEIFSNKFLQPNPLLIRYFKSLDYHFNPKYYTNGKVADVGSGFGFITFWLILSGANKVYSIGDTERILFIERLYNRAVEKGLIQDGKLYLKPGFIKSGDTTLSDAIDASSLDLVLLNDTLEHIAPRIFPSLVKSVYHDLKPGGIFISSQHNSDSPVTLIELRKGWERDELSYYFNQRLNLVESKIKGIAKTEALELAKRTRGLDSIDFIKALEVYQVNNKFPNHNLDVPPIDVENDVSGEGLTEIKRICDEFRKNRFRTIRVYPNLLTLRRSRFLQRFAKILPFLFFKMHIFDENSVFWMKK